MSHTGRTPSVNHEPIPDEETAEMQRSWEQAAAAGTRAYRLGRYAEAEAEFTAALTLAESFEPGDARLATSLNNLGEALRARGRFDEAEALFQRSLALREQRLGPDHPHVASCLNNLGVLYAEHGRPTDAEALLGRALAIQRPAGDRTHPDAATTLMNLGDLHRQRGGLDDARRCYADAADLLNAAGDPDDPDLATCLVRLGAVSPHGHDEGRPSGMIARGLSVLERVLGSNHPAVADALCDLALSHLEHGHPDDAVPLLHRARAILQHVFDAEHPRVMRCTALLARATREAAATEPVAMP